MVSTTGIQTAIAVLAKREASSVPKFPTIGLSILSAAFLFGFFGAAPVTVPTASATGLAGVTPHRALYRLTLDEVQGAGGIEQADGLIAFQWRRDCEAVSISEAYVIRLYLDQGKVSEFGATFEGVERLDGDHFDFRFEQTGAGETIVANGEATREEGGVAVELRPREKEPRVFGQEVVFPGYHTGALIEAAQGGRPLVVFKVFDGSDLDGPTLISTAIGKEREVEPMMGSDRGWPMTLAFFSQDATDETPSYQLSMILRDNGIASDLRLDYGEFVLNGKLEVLEERPSPSC